MEPDLIRTVSLHPSHPCENKESNEYGKRVITIRVTDQLIELQTILRDKYVHKKKVWKNENDA